MSEEKATHKYDRLTEIEGRLAAATPIENTTLSADTRAHGLGMYVEFHGDNAKSDKDLFKNVQADMSYLVAEIRRLRAENEDTRLQVAQLAEALTVAGLGLPEEE